METAAAKRKGNNQLSNGSGNESGSRMARRLLTMIYGGKNHGLGAELTNYLN
jgi:hypothetical protein